MKFSIYMLGNFLRSFLLVTLGSVLIFLVIDFVGNIRMWLTRGLEDASGYYLNYLPYIVYLILPIALLISVVSSLGTMARHLELTAIQASGRSGLRMITPILLLGVGLSAGMYWMGEMILPDANHRRLELVQPGRKKVERVKEKSFFVYVGSEKHSWFFRHYSSVRREARQVILLTSDKGDLVERFDAQRLVWVPVGNDSLEENGHWEMDRGFRRTFLPDGSIQVEPFERKSLKGMVPTRPSDLIFSRQSPDEMDSKTILQRIAAQRRSGEDTKLLETHWHFKMAGPFVALVTLLFGSALAHRYSRSGGLSTKFGVGLFISFAYYICIKVGLQMGEGGVLAPWLGAWIATLGFGALGFVLLVRSFRL